MPFTRILTHARRSWRERKSRRADVVAEEVDQALRELEAIGRKALILGPRRYEPRSRWHSRRRRLTQLLARNRVRLYVAITCAAFAGAWLIVAEHRG